MATFRKRGRRWQAIVRHKGTTEARSFDTKGQAQEWARQREARLGAGSCGTLVDAMLAYERDVVPHKRGERWERIRLAKLRSLPFADKPMGKITPGDITDWARGSDLAPGTIKRELSLLSSVFTYARKTLQWPVESPIRDAIIPKTPPPRTQRMSDDQVDAIVAACGYERWDEPKTALHRTALALLFALETMMRAGEICGIERRHVHARHVHLPKTKNGEARDVPLSARARQILDLVPDGFGMSPGVLDALFRKARDTAAKRDPSIASIHFHDSRREAATRLSKKLDVMELARMGGWKKVDILYRTYYAPSVESLADKL